MHHILEMARVCIYFLECVSTFQNKPIYALTGACYMLRTLLVLSRVPPFSLGTPWTLL